MKNNLTNLTSQQEIRNSIDIRQNTLKIQPVSNLIDIFKSLSKSRKKTLNQLIHFSSYYRNIFCSQRTIGLDTGNCRQTINEAVKELEELGFISTTYYHRRTKSYRIASFFHNPFIRSAFLSLLPALKNLVIFGSLLSFCQKDDTNLFKNNSYRNSLLTTKKIESSYDQEILKKRELLKKEELKRERLTMNVHKLFKEHEIPEAIYEANKLKGERKSFVLLNTKDPQITQAEKDRELSKIISAIKPPENYNAILINNAKRFAEQVKQNKTTASIALRKLGTMKKEVPAAAVDLFRHWMNTPEGRETMAILASS